MGSDLFIVMSFLILFSNKRLVFSVLPVPHRGQSFDNGGCRTCHAALLGTGGQFRTWYSPLCINSMESTCIYNICNLLYLQGFEDCMLLNSLLDLHQDNFGNWPTECFTICPSTIYIRTFNVTLILITVLHEIVTSMQNFIFIVLLMKTRHDIHFRFIYQHILYFWSFEYSGCFLGLLQN